MNFSFDKIVDFLYDNYKLLLWVLILILQLVLILKIGNLWNDLKILDQKFSNIQTILWVSTSDTNQAPVINAWILNPIEDKKVLLPVKPDTSIWIAYIEKWYTEMDNYYPVWKSIVYASSLEVSQVWDKYKNQLVNTWWQVLNINNSTGKKPYVNMLKATNWQNTISVEFLEKFDNYNKKAWSFVKITIEN